MADPEVVEDGRAAREQGLTPQCMADADGFGGCPRARPATPHRRGARAESAAAPTAPARLMSPRAQCSIECVWALTNREEDALAAIDASLAERLRLANLGDLPIGHEDALSRILSICRREKRWKSVPGGAWGIGEVDAMPGPGTVECLDIFRRLLAAAYDMSSAKLSEGDRCRWGERPAPPNNLGAFATLWPLFPCVYLSERV